MTSIATCWSTAGYRVSMGPKHRKPNSRRLEWDPLMICAPPALRYSLLAAMQVWDQTLAQKSDSCGLGRNLRILLICVWIYVYIFKYIHIIYIYMYKYIIYIYIYMYKYIYIYIYIYNIYIWLSYPVINSLNSSQIGVCDRVSGLFLEGKHPDNTSVRLIHCNYVPIATVFQKQWYNSNI